MPLPLKMNKSRQDFFTVYLDGFSQAELVHIAELRQKRLQLPLLFMPLGLTGESRDNSAKKL